MSQDIRDFVPASCDLLAFGEPAHREPAHRHARNEMVAQLAGLGFRSIALEIDRVAALAVDDFVREGAGTLDEVMRDGFTHDFGALDGNRELVEWMRAYNSSKPPEDRLALHGFDAPTETMSAPSPRRYLEYARDYLGLDVDIAGPAGDDERWSRQEAILDAAESVGASPEAERLRVLGDDILGDLYARAPEMVAATSLDAWRRAEIHLTAGLDLLRYHRMAARPGETSLRVSRLSATRDAIMARNLLGIRSLGRTFVFAHNTHLQRTPSRWALPGLDLQWNGAGAIVASLGTPYTFIAGSLGRSSALHLAEPDPDTYEGFLQSRVGLTATSEIPAARTRTDVKPEQGYLPLNQTILDGADAVLHIDAH